MMRLLDVPVNRDFPATPKVRLFRERVLHTILTAAQAILLPLPPDSPDFHPIEACWSKIKEGLQSAQARAAEALQQAIAHAFATVTASDAHGWFQHCGYQAG
jgi:transposase